MKKKLENIFSWSKTRDDVFRMCLRRYFYEYYASWGGWEEKAPPLTREIYLLKKLKTRHMWAGDLVHRAIQRSITNMIRKIPVLEAERIIEITLNMMRNEFRSSRRQNYRKVRSLGLFEHEYGIPVPDEQWREVAANVENCLRNFYASPLFAALAALDSGNFLEVETLSHFDFEGTRCWVVLDAAYRDETGINIVDWKTGRQAPGGNELQLAGYALYAAEAWGADPAELTLMEYNLFHDRLHHYKADRATIERTRSYIRGSIADMQSLLTDARENMPLPEDRFMKVEKEDICSTCNFQKVCLPEFRRGQPAMDGNT